MNKNEIICTKKWAECPAELLGLSHQTLIAFLSDYATSFKHRVASRHLVYYFNMDYNGSSVVLLINRTEKMRTKCPESQYGQTEEQDNFLWIVPFDAWSKMKRKIKMKETW